MIPPRVIRSPTRHPTPQSALHIFHTLRCVKLLSTHLASALGYTFVTSFQVADPPANPQNVLHICQDTLSVRYVAHLSHLVSALRYTFVTPLQVADPLSDPSECVQHHNTRGNTKRKPPCTNEELIETLYTARSAARGAKSLASNEVRRPIFEDFSLEVQTCILCNESK